LERPWPPSVWSVIAGPAEPIPIPAEGGAREFAACTCGELTSIPWRLKLPELVGSGKFATPCDRMHGRTSARLPAVLRLLRRAGGLPVGIQGSARLCGSLKLRRSRQAATAPARWTRLPLAPGSGSSETVRLDALGVGQRARLGASRRLVAAADEPALATPGLAEPPEPPHAATSRPNPTNAVADAPPPRSATVATSPSPVIGYLGVVHVVLLGSGPASELLYDIPAYRGLQVL